MELGWFIFNKVVRCKLSLNWIATKGRRNKRMNERMKTKRFTQKHRLYLLEFWLRTGKIYVFVVNVSIEIETLLLSQTGIFLFSAVVYEKKAHEPNKKKAIYIFFQTFVNVIEIRYSRLSRVSDATKSLFALQNASTLSTTSYHYPVKPIKKN